MVPEGGIEPPRPCGHRILSPARLPVSPLRRQVLPAVQERPGANVQYTEAGSARLAVSPNRAWGPILNGGGAMRPRNGALVAVVVFVLAAFAWGRAAQADRGILAGTIKNVSGAAVPGVRVEAQGPVTASAVTDARGTFRIVNLVPGDYVVTATLAGFATTTARARIAPRNETRIALELRAGPLNEAVVTGQATSMDAETSARQVTGTGQFRTAGSPRPLEALAAAAAPPFLSDPVERRRRGRNTESYDHIDENGFKHVSAD